MDRGPVALFGAIVAVGLGPAMWLGAQLGSIEVDPSRPPAVVGEPNSDPDRLVGGSGAGDSGDDSVIDATPQSEAVPPTTSPRPTATSPSPTTPPASSPSPEPSETGESTTPPTESTTTPATPPTGESSSPTIPPEPPTDDGPGPGGDPSDESVDG